VKHANPIPVFAKSHLWKTAIRRDSAIGTAFAFLSGMTVDQERFVMRFLVFVAILFAIFHVALLLKMAFAIILALALATGFWVLWRLKWVILAIFGLEELL
jgi:hypothetical protein